MIDFFFFIRSLQLPRACSAESHEVLGTEMIFWLFPSKCPARGWQFRCYFMLTSAFACCRSRCSVRNREPLRSSGADGSSEQGARCSRERCARERGAVAVAAQRSEAVAAGAALGVWKRPFRATRSGGAGCLRALAIPQHVPNSTRPRRGS